MTMLSCEISMNVRRDFCWKAAETYSSRTENANTTIAFNLSLIRRDHTSNNEMPNMKTSSAMAEISMAHHNAHWVQLD